MLGSGCLAGLGSGFGRLGGIFILGICLYLLFCPCFFISISIYCSLLPNPPSNL